jgi:F-type H+-transporting ATPase subunit b
MKFFKTSSPRKTWLAALATVGSLFVATTGLASPHNAPPEDLNWIWGLVNTQKGLEEPNLLFRPEGMPAPVLAFVINALILFGVIWWFGHKPIRTALQQRRDRIMGGMDAAAKMKAEAEAQLALHMAKLEKVEEEIERLKTEMRESAEAEREHVLREARDRAGRMQREAVHLIEQETKAARQDLMKETVRAAFVAAEDMLRKQANAMDHQRIADDYVTNLPDAVAKARGGEAA